MSVVSPLVSGATVSSSDGMSVVGAITASGTGAGATGVGSGTDRGGVMLRTTGLGGGGAMGGGGGGGRTSVRTTVGSGISASGAAMGMASIAARLRCSVTAAAMATLRGRLKPLGRAEDVTNVAVRMAGSGVGPRFQRMTPRDGVGGYHPAMASSAHRSLMLLSAALLATVLVGCTRDAEPSDAPAEAPADGGLAALPEDFEGAWAGVLPCADCEGIDVELELQRESGAAGRYRLVETYLGAADAVGFEIAGEWREDACRVGEIAGSCLVLLESGQRWFRHADGSLQAVDAEGRALDPEGARLQRR